MQRYWWPGFEKHLLVELQRQQNNVQFCDTLLQTEGISIPTHSCVLAALSPYLSEKLSASPSPPPGQKYHLRLHAVKAKPLLKLVALLYSGAMCVRGSIEQEDVLALARRFGITGLEEGQRDGPIREGDCSLLRLNEFHSEDRRTVQVQTEPRLDHRSDLSAGLQSQPLTSDEMISSNWSCVHPNTHTTTAETPTHTTETNPTSGQGSLGHPTISVSLSSTMGSSSDQKDNFCHLPSVINCSCDLDEDGTEVEIGGRNLETSGDRGQQTQEDLSWGEETDMSDVGVRMNLKRSQTIESAVKVKLRRTMKTKHESWEVVQTRDTDGLNPGGLNTDLTEVKSSSSTDPSMVLQYPYPKSLQESHPQTPSVDVLLSDLNPPDSSGVQSLTPIAHTSPEQIMDSQCSGSSQCSTNNFPTSSDSQETSRAPLTPDQSTAREASPLLQSQDCVEESDEQEKLLEDIMMSLHFLPDLEENPSIHYHGQPSICQDLGPSQTLGPVGAGSEHFTQESGTGTYNTFTETGVQSGSTEENLPPCPGLSSVLSEATMMQQQHDHHTLQQQQDQSSVKSLWKINGLSRQVTSSDKSNLFLCPDKPTPRPVLPSTFPSAVQETCYPEFPGFSGSLQHNIEFLPLMNGKQTESLHNLSLLCMADMRLPPCLSPVPLCTTFRNPPALLKHDWLREKPASGQFPWTVVTTTPTSAHPEERPESKKTKRHQVQNVAVAPKRRKANAKTHPPDGGTSVKACDLSQNEQILVKGEVSLSNNNVPKRTRKTANCTQKTRRSVVTVEQRRIRTRNYLKITQKPSDTSNKDVPVVAVASEKYVPTERSDKSDICAEVNTPEVRKQRNTHRSRTSILKEFKKFIKMQHSKTRNSKEKQKSNHTKRHADTEETMRTDVTFNGSPVRLQPGHEDAAETEKRRKGSSTALDENHNRTLDQSDIKKRRSRQEDRDGCHGDDPSVTTRMKTAMELQPNDHNTISDTVQKGQDDDRPQPAGVRRSPSSVEEEMVVVEEMVLIEENKEEEEVDVLTFSPVRVQSREEQLLSSDIVPDEEEDVDVDEVDVTGDDTD